MRSDVCRILGENIRHKRRSMDWTLIRLGKSLGISYQQVQKYEKGANRVPVDVLVLMAELFGCSLDELCGLRPQEIDPDLVMILRKVSGMRSPCLQRKIVELIEILGSAEVLCSERRD